MRALSRVLAMVENWTVIVSFVVIVVVTFVNIVSRYVTKSSIAFTEEITINLLVVLTMSGAVVAIRERAHLGFTFFLDKSRGPSKTALTWLVALLVILFLLVLIVYGGEMLINQAGRGRSTPSLQIPQWLFTLAIPLCGVLGVYRIIESAARSTAEPTDEPSSSGASVAYADLAGEDLGSVHGGKQA